MAKKANKKQLRKANEMLNANVTDLNGRLRVTEEGRQAWQQESERYQRRYTDQRDIANRQVVQISTLQRQVEAARQNTQAADRHTAEVREQLETTKGRFEDALQVIDGVRQWIDSTDVTLQEVFNDASETLRELLPDNA